jgi:hypothetical protein
MKHHEMYNLADIIRYNFDAGLDFDHDTIAYKYISQVNSQLISQRNYKYYHKHGNSLPNVEFRLLRDIVDKHQPVEKQDDTITIHCRVGDKLGQYNLIDSVVTAIESNNLNKTYKQCRLFYGLHRDIKKLESDQIILNLSDKLMDRFNLHTEIVSNDADSDFSDLSNANCYIPTVGGFSGLAASINPNNVIWDIFDAHNRYHPHDLYQIQSFKVNQLQEHNKL